MSGTTEMLLNFDYFLSNNYPKLFTHAMVLTHNEEDATDLLHQTYVKIKNFIIASGYTTQRYITFFCRSITNTFIDIKRKKKVEIQELHDIIDTEESYVDIEDRILEQEYLCKFIFKYVEQHYDPKEQIVFRAYYLYPPNERMTYKRLAAITGTYVMYCSDTIRKIREDLQKNLMRFIWEQQQKTLSN